MKITKKSVLIITIFGLFLCKIIYSTILLTLYAGLFEPNNEDVERWKDFIAPIPIYNKRENSFTSITIHGCNQPRTLKNNDGKIVAVTAIGNWKFSELSVSLSCLPNEHIKPLPQNASAMWDAVEIYAEKDFMIECDVDDKRLVFQEDHLKYKTYIKESEANNSLEYVYIIAKTEDGIPLCIKYRKDEKNRFRYIASRNVDDDFYINYWVTGGNQSIDSIILNDAKILKFAKDAKINKLS